MLKDICIFMSRREVKKFYVLNTGVSTIKGLELAAEELKELGIEMTYTDILRACRGVEKGEHMLMRSKLQ